MIDYISIIKMGSHLKFIQSIEYVPGYVLRQISNYTDTHPRFANCLFDVVERIEQLRGITSSVETNPSGQEMNGAQHRFG